MRWGQARRLAAWGRHPPAERENSCAQQIELSCEAGSRHEAVLLPELGQASGKDNLHSSRGWPVKACHLLPVCMKLPYKNQLNSL